MTRAARTAVFVLGALAVAVSLAPGGQPASGNPRLAAASGSEPFAGLQLNIEGHVTNFKGEPLGQIAMELVTGGSAKPLRQFATSAKGEFQVSIEPGATDGRSVTLIAKSDGYDDAREDVWLSLEGKTPSQPVRVDLMLRSSEEDINQLPLAALMRYLTPRLRYLTVSASTSGTGSVTNAVADQYSQAAQVLLDRKDAFDAVPLIEKIVAQAPDCVQCRVLLGLALVERGSWASGWREFTRAATLDTASTGASPSLDPFLIMGVLESWRGRLRRAAVHLLEALEVDPQNAMALQELGRVSVLENRMPAGDRYLAAALKRGALPEARLLRAQALITEGARDQAEAELQAYLGDRKLKELPDRIRAQWTDLENQLNSVVPKPASEATPK